MDDNNKTPQVIQEELAKRNREVASSNEIVFDPVTGELMVVTPRDRAANPDATPITQIATDGFA